MSSFGLLFSIVFIIFYMGFASRLFLSRITEQQDKGMLSSLPLPTASEFSKTITAESSPLQIVSGRTWTRNRWLLSAFCSNFKDVIIITSGLITLVRHNQFPRNCYWLVIGSTEQTFKMWLLQLRIVWTSINKTFSAPSAKQEWILRFFLARKPWRQKQIQFVGVLGKIIKWCNDNDFFPVTSFHNPCNVVCLVDIVVAHNMSNSKCQ